jgi:DnaJ-domain-containing protein 1
MGIFDRLEDLILSYARGGKGSGTAYSRRGSGDPDLDAAFEELDDFLSGGGGKGSGERGAGSGGSGGSSTGPAGSADPGVPGELRRDFAELGLEPGASAEECKAAYKRLLMLHHPDRHAGHEGNMRKATEKSARINAAYDRIEKWRRGTA